MLCGCFDSSLPHIIIALIANFHVIPLIFFVLCFSNLRYLLPCNHILPNQKRTIKEMDFFCKSATMFLYLTPSSCVQTNKQPVDAEESSPLIARVNHFNGSPKSLSSNHSSKSYSPKSQRSNQSPKVGRKVSATSNTSTVSRTSSNNSIQPELKTEETLEFMAYLYDVKETICACKQACKCWSAVYDGMDVVAENPRLTSKRPSQKSLSAFSFSESFLLRSPSITSTDSDIAEFSPRVPEVVDNNMYASSDCLGPFLNALFDKIEMMMDSNLYVNLQLTNLVTRLACYPQPLIRSFLLNSNLMIQPGVRSLAQV